MQTLTSPINTNSMAVLIREQLRKAERMNTDQRTACRIGVVSIAYGIADTIKDDSEASAFMTACGL